MLVETIFRRTACKTTCTRNANFFLGSFSRLRTARDVISKILYGIEHHEKAFPERAVWNASNEKCFNKAEAWKHFATDIAASSATKAKFSLTRKRSRKKRTRKNLSKKSAKHLFVKCCVFYNVVSRSTLELHCKCINACTR